jgi:hypothetical protein
MVVNYPNYRNRLGWLMASVVVAWCVALFVANPVDAAQTTPYQINYQGRLTDAAGNPKPDGQYNMTFRLYSVATAGSAVWTETYDTTNRITLTGGQFSVQLGSLAALSPSVFTSQPLYLEIEFPTPATATCSAASCAVYTEGPMTPRQTLASSAYAMNADTIDGYDSSSFAVLGNNNTFTSGNLFKPATNSTSAFGVQKSDGTSLFNIDTSGGGVSVGGTFTPGTTVGVAGTSASPPPTTDGTGIFTKVNSGASGGNILQVNAGYDYTEAAPNNKCQVAIYTDAAGKPGTLIASSGPVTLQPGSNNSVGAPTSIPLSATLAANTTYWLVALTNGVAAGNQMANDDLNGVSYTVASMPYASGFPTTAPSGTSGTNTMYLTITYQGAAKSIATLTSSGQVGINTTTPAAVLETDGSALFSNVANSVNAFRVQNSSSLALLTTDTTNNMVQIGSSTADATAVLLVLDASSGTFDPTGYPGAMYYNSAMGRARCYEGGAWGFCTGISNVNLTSDVVNNSGTANTMTNVTGLSFTVVTGHIYHFSALINYTAAATTTGSRWSVSGPASIKSLSYTSKYTLTATTQTVNNATAYDIPAAANASSLTVGNIAKIEGTINPTSTGTLQIRFASGVASSAITAKAGSSLTWW